MNGVDHYIKAEQLLDRAYYEDAEYARDLVAQAQVHALLAQASAAALAFAGNWSPQSDEGREGLRVQVESWFAHALRPVVDANATDAESASDGHREPHFGVHGGCLCGCSACDEGYTCICPDCTSIYHGHEILAAVMA